MAKKTTNTTSNNDLAEITKQMYSQNADLAVKNKTLSTLSKLYEIINTSLSVEESARQIVETIVKELQFQGSAIALINHEKRHLETASVYHENNKDQNIAKILRLIHGLSLPLKRSPNLIVKIIHQKKTKQTHKLYDLLVPLVTKEVASQMQEVLGAKTFICYPLVLAKNCFGVLIIGLGKGVVDLSRSERDTLKELVDVVAIAIERAQIYASLKMANKKLKELDQLKDDFVSVASHELRTPMTAIKSYLWMALNGKGGPISTKESYYLHRAYSSTDRLIKLVNDMLNISRIESGRMTYEMQRVDMVALVKEVFEEVTPRSQELGVFIKFDKKYKENPQFTTLHDAKIGHLKKKLARVGGIETDGEMLMPVLADPDKIKEVIFNLIGNSLKFTDTGGSITVSFVVKGRFVETIVTDTGVGMEKEDLDKLFRKFGLMQGSYQTTKKASIGTGLGLYICKLIVDTHGGTITASSEGVGKGSTFNFTLPIYNKKAKPKQLPSSKAKEKIDVIHSGL